MISFLYLVEYKITNLIFLILDKVCIMLSSNKIITHILLSNRYQKLNKKILNKPVSML